ncbi:MAG: SCO family protein [Candidatus Binatus sp.]|uniref:SCO family protein n=1 Tax=Candidatus Binatus sp. TaxID=2811406 RepID=UPI002718F14E|nr:SCO family protein [Candidatus Binatus sp.]MDO8431472.1 SCO family protein [Candidatus Binatus sp.]
MKSRFAVSIRRHAMYALAIAAAVSFAACGGRATNSAPSLGPGLQGVSPKLVLFNQDAKPVEARSLTGKPLLIAFIDTACTGMCQLTTNNLHRVADELGAAQGQNVQFVLVTYNPVFDGPKRLARYARDMHLDTSRWTC